jgi:voltage-gated potassium channel
MFIVTFLFLLCAGALLHLTDGDLLSPIALKILAGMGFLYLFFVAETVAHWRCGGKNMRQHIGYLLMPIARLCPRDHDEGDRSWIPGLGWRKRTSRLEKYLARVFSGPMIVIALLVLPVVGAEFFYAEKIDENTSLKFFINSCGAFIWMAFVFEFVVMVSVVERKVRYCKQNWIDLLVVLLPLGMFMGAARLGKLLKLKQLSRTAKIYRMRGLALRSWRAVVALDVIDMLLRRDPNQRVDNLYSQIEERQQEIDHLRSEIERLKKKSNYKPELEIDESV